MSPQSADHARVEKHKANFSLMDSEHLIALWSTSTDEDWTPEGLEALREVIVERLGFLPRQGISYAEVASPDIATYHDSEVVERLALRLETLSSICKILAILALLAAGAVFFTSMATFSGGQVLPINLLDLMYSANAALGYLQLSVILFALVYGLRMAGEAALLLMDIENNTRTPRAPIDQEAPQQPETPSS